MVKPSPSRTGKRSETTPETGRPVGRPREFDEDEVVERAVQLFWEQGYEGTSLDELLEATGMARQSLYRVFGNKHGLFLRALERYGDTRMRGAREALLANDSPREALLGLLDMWEQAATAEDFSGCLCMNSLTEFACQGDADIRARTLVEVDALENALAKTLGLGVELGELSLGRAPHVVAHMIVGVGVALTHLGRSGARPEVVRSIVTGARDLLGG